MPSLKKNKECVEILSGNTIKSRKKYPVENNVVILEKPGKGRGKVGWMPKYNESCFIYRHNLFGILKRKLTVIEGSTHCIDYISEDKEAATYPVTISILNEWYKANILKHAGQSTQSIKVPLALYLIVGAVLVLQVIQFLAMQGIIRV